MHTGGVVLTGIVRHLVRHPDALDTAEGIAHWWREPGDPAWPPQELEGALQQLVEWNWIAIRETAGIPLFMANPEALERMAQFRAGRTKE